jgi:hypothetical protein
MIDWKQAVFSEKLFRHLFVRGHVYKNDTYPLRFEPFTAFGDIGYGLPAKKNIRNAAKKPTGRVVAP